jgi:L-lactate dehydrogenase
LPEITTWRRTHRLQEAGLLVVILLLAAFLTYAALRFTGLPERQVCGSGTVLDTGRLRNLIARRRSGSRR